MLTGGLFDLPAGKVRFSATGAHRQNRFSFDPDSARESSDIIGTLSTAPSRGKVSVTEGALDSWFRS